MLAKYSMSNKIGKDFISILKKGEPHKGSPFFHQPARSNSNSGGGVILVISSSVPLYAL